MAEPKSFASLSSTLLARKGSAKPAMRPQGWGQGMGLEDLGWNDMGQGPAPAHAYVPQYEERPEHVPSSIAALTPAPRSTTPVTVIEPVPSPVVEQQRVIELSFAESAPEPEPTPVPAEPTKAKVVALPPRPRQSAGAKAKAAFTLRLEAERHLRLRLACAVTHRSAQQLVTEALDTFLATLPELDAMAGHLPASAGKRS
ncbi:MAG TPA: hypothetical protein VF631_02465 [Allosphingosinicella sp.]|jgi:hypothetical protein|uniref:hypothetical protein n=1 Tax=Allosphingosinicella sp. TaxID=2823234 RepID=UPI002F2A21E6